MTLAYSTSLDTSCFRAAEVNLRQQGIDGVTLAKFTLGAYATLDKHWGGQWPKATHQAYNDLAIGTIEHCLITARGREAWERVQRWTMNTMIKTLIPPHLWLPQEREGDYFARQGLSEPSNDELIPVLRDWELWDFVRCMAIISMDPPGRADNLRSSSPGHTVWEVMFSALKARHGEVVWHTFLPGSCSAPYNVLASRILTTEVCSCLRVDQQVVQCTVLLSGIAASRGERARAVEILFDTLLVTTLCLQTGSRVTSPMHPVQRQRARAQA
ncbi:hypothetical protein C8Q76DRAFT_329505 [Earliella scabrosa]|nr:hypothetical protein C8Q76DRAFT_329505 [Earliella scabrosa]